MKISNNLGADSKLSNLDKAKSKSDDNLGALGKNKQGTSSADINSAAKVNLSESAQRMNKAKAIASEPSINDAKVERLQKLIDGGEYKIDASAVADRLVDEHLLMS